MLSGDCWPGVRLLNRACFSIALVTAVALGQIGASSPAHADYTDGVVAENTAGLETAVGIWRKAGWQNDDFLSEIRLGDIYGDERPDNRYGDPVEAYVWYYLASISTRIGDYIGDPNVRRVISNDFHRALSEQQKLMLLFSAEQREQARDRIVYILSCRGPDGFIRLGQIHSTLNDDGRWGRTNTGAPLVESPMTYGGLGALWHAQRDFRDRTLHEFDTGDAAAVRRMMGIPANSVIVPNDAEALLYFHIADNLGHPLAREYLRSLEAAVRSTRGFGPRIAQEAADRAHYWFPAYEFYPLGESASRVRYSDECTIDTQRQRALALVDMALPPRAVQQAVSFLGLGPTPPRWTGGTGEFRPVSHLQASRVVSGRHLSPLQMVRLIQMAALRGDAVSQNTLGVMYARGVGVPANYARAAYWFAKSADQRDAAALYHLGVLYRKGPEGVHQDLAKANDYFTAAAATGFRPAMNELVDLFETADSQRVYGHEQQRPPVVKGE